MSPWQVLSSRLLWERPPQRLRLDRCRTSRGHEVEDYLVREVNDIALVFALTADSEVVLVRQYRHGIGELSLELPQGLLEDGEDWLAGGARELREETGYAVESLERVAVLAAHPALQTSRVHVLLGRGAAPSGRPEPEPDEDLTVEVTPLAEVERRIASGELRAASSVAAAFLVLGRLRSAP